MKQQLMMLLLGTASVLCSCETQIKPTVSWERKNWNYVLW